MKYMLILFIAVCSHASSFYKNGELNLIDDKEYIIRCIEGTKWIQFIERMGRDRLYSNVGIPQQMLESTGASAIPVKCNKDKNESK